VVSSFADTKVLIFDLDAQMSLTQAIALNEDTGQLHPKFQKWYETAINRKKTIFHALDEFTKPAAGKFDFGDGISSIRSPKTCTSSLPSRTSTGLSWRSSTATA
jgi:chromosome partitioning protein